MKETDSGRRWTFIMTMGYFVLKPKHDIFVHICSHLLPVFVYYFIRNACAWCNPSRARQEIQKSETRSPVQLDELPLCIDFIHLLPTMIIIIASCSCFRWGWEKSIHSGRTNWPPSFRQWNCVSDAVESSDEVNELGRWIASIKCTYSFSHNSRAHYKRTHFA